MAGTGGLTVPELLSARATLQPDRAALIVDGAGSLTFESWDRRSNEVARGLMTRGLRRGDRIGLVFGERDWIDFAVASSGAHKAGGVTVPLSMRLAPAAVRAILHDCQVVGALHGSHAQGDLVSGGAWQATVGELAAEDGSQVPGIARPGDLAQILYTSGTTGRPKGVAATHANLTFGCQPYPRDRRRPGALKLAHSRFLVHAFPIGSNAAQTMLITALDAEPTAVTLPRFTPERFARLIESYRAGTVFVVPTMAIELLSAGVQQRHDLSSVLLLGSTAASLPAPVAVGLAAAFPNATIVNYYTSTEAAPAQTVMLVDPTRPGSVGRAAPGSEIKIVDPSGQRARPGEVGEVWMRSAADPRAYIDAASGGHGGAAPTEAGVGGRDDGPQVFRDGWVRMGDIGYLDEAGYLYLVDRESDVIKSAGLKVSTIAIEAALYAHPAVAQAAVVGVPHPVLGMSAAAAVVTRSAVTATELRGFLLTRLAAHEIPTRLVFVDSLPRNHLGKVLKTKLRDMLQQPGTPIAN